MNLFCDSDLSRNDFLGGRVRLWQPVAGYRAGVDPILLAASVPAVAGQSVLDLGCGAGAACLCLEARVPGLQLTGVELQAPYADLARRNAAENHVGLDVYECDLTGLPSDLRQRQFDHVIANPPYYQGGGHSPAADKGRNLALSERTPLKDWVTVAAKRLSPRGYLHMIQKADRLPDMLSACAGLLGSIEVLPICARIGRNAELVVLRARKDGRAAFRLHAGLILHQGAQHDEDRENYTAAISDVLRNAAPLPGFSVS
ncbi:MAG: methyltransferase [Pseudomonadota bacterium]